MARNIADRLEVSFVSFLGEIGIDISSETSVFRDPRSLAARHFIMDMSAVISAYNRAEFRIRQLEEEVKRLKG